MSALEYFSEHKTPAVAGATAILLVCVGAYMVLHISKPEAPPPPPHTVTMVMIKPPPPPPPPKPMLQPKTITQPKVALPTPKPVTTPQPPKAAPPKAASAPRGVGTSLKGNGSSNAFDLNGSGNTNGIIGGTGDGDGGGGGSYGAGLQVAITQALQKNAVTRNAAAGLVVSIWLDASGRIAQVRLEKSSGNAKVDDAITNQVLRNMQYIAPPPDMQMPIKMSLVGETPMQ